MMKRATLFLLFTAILVFRSSESAQAQFQWPGGARAAVCLTYDDGLDCHLDVAVPQLEEFGFRGTFYCTGSSGSLNNRMEEWRKIVKDGHELGNHSLFHPCDGNKYDWVRPEFDLNHYTVNQLLEELRIANTLLKAVDGKPRRTYAFTCSDYIAGGEDFSEKIKPFFSAARCDGPIPETMEGFNIYKTPSWGVVDPTAEELIAYINEAKEKGTIAIFMFHSVGGGYLNVGAREHRELLQYLNEHRKEFFTGTFMEVMDYIKTNL